MIQWQIEYWAGDRTKNPVEKWLLELSKEQFKAIAKELRILKELGNELRLPHSKSLGEGLFELRERRYGYRIYYGFSGKKLIILLAAGDKTSQERDIKIARERLSSM
jgi:putative addiction module killer protein